MANGETSGQLWRPTGLQEVGEAIYFGDYGPAANQGLIQKYKAQEGVSVVAQVPGNPFGMVIENGEIVISDLWNQRILKLGDVPGLGEAPSELGEGVQILTEIDGVPLTIGESVTLQAQARDPQGQDITAQIQWTDQTGKVLGTGRDLTYTATETQMLTITANVGGKWDRVSTTISPSDVTVAPHVKVLSDQVADRVKVVDEENGVIRLADEELSYPTIRESDVVIGANGLVPPMKVIGIAREEGDLVLSVEPALPKEVIDYGTATFEETIDWSGSSGEVTIVDIPGEPYHIAEDLEPKWEGFVRAGDPIQTGLKVTASVDLEWMATFKGEVILDKQIGDGISNLSLNIDSKDILVNYQISEEGIANWVEFEAKRFPIPQVQRVTRVYITLGPVIIPLTITNTVVLDIDPASLITGDNHLSMSFDLGFVSDELGYNGSLSSWDYRNIAHGASKIATGTEDPNTRFEFYGGINVTLLPSFTTELFSLASPGKGIRFRSAEISVDDILETTIDTNRSQNNSTLYFDGLELRAHPKIFSSVQSIFSVNQIDDSSWIEPSMLRNPVSLRDSKRRYSNFIMIDPCDETSRDCEARNNLDETADSFISRCRKASIRREFPSEMLSLTLGDIKRGNTATHKKAWKLLNDNRFKK